MSKAHSGNRGLHKFRRSRYFTGGGWVYATVALLIIIAMFTILILALRGAI